MRFGPGVIVAAAFIGPGTIVTASRAGAEYGLGLLWTVLFATVGAIVLQSLAARIGILSRNGLGAYLRNWLHQSLWFKFLAGLVILAIGVGNAAYQAGNLSGAAQGLQSFAPNLQSWWLGGLILVTGAILLFGSFRRLQRVLVGLVLLLSFCFVAAAIWQLGAPTEILTGLAAPTFSSQSLSLTLAMIGTTVVPYNLFLHAKTAASNWDGVEQERALRQADWDAILAIGLGGIVTASIVVTAMGAFHNTADSENLSLAAISTQLEPALGRWSGMLFNCGLFAAGLTSSITAPLAAGYAIGGLLGWQGKDQAWKETIVALAILAIGGCFALLAGKSPAQLIVVAQVANGLMLPVVASIVLVAAQREKGDGGSQPLSLPRALAGGIVVCLVSALALWKLLS